MLCYSSVVEVLKIFLPRLFPALCLKIRTVEKIYEKKISTHIIFLRRKKSELSIMILTLCVTVKKEGIGSAVSFKKHTKNDANIL